MRTVYLKTKDNEIYAVIPRKNPNNIVKCLKVGDNGVIRDKIYKITENDVKYIDTDLEYLKLL